MLSTEYIPKQSNKESDKNADRVTFNEYWNISVWAMKFLFSCHPFYASLYIGSTFIDRLSSLITTYLLARVLDNAIVLLKTPGATIKDILPAILVLLLINVLLEIVSFLGRYAEHTILSRASITRLQQYYTKVASLGIQTLEQADVNNLLVKADDGSNFLSGFTREQVNLLSQLFRVVASLVIILSFLPWVVPILILTMIPAYLMDKKYRRLDWLHYNTTAEDQRKFGAVVSYLRDPHSLQEILINKAFNYLDMKYMSFRRWFENVELTINLAWLRVRRFISLLCDISVYIGLVAIFDQFLHGVTTAGGVMFRLDAIRSFRSSLDMTLQMINDNFERSLRLRELYQLFHMKPYFVDGTTEIAKLTKGPAIEFKNIDFSYADDTPLVIKGLNLKINSGEKVALVGANGAGKTTLVKILCRFYAVTNGEILVNDININELTSESFYQNVGILFQDFSLYSSLTVRENIALGDPTRPYDEVAMRLAAQSADATSFIDEYPQKYDQLLSERYTGGIRPSTGQSQKIAIARFFYRDAPLVIFDEPTASIDALSEYNIFNQIYSFFKNKTVVIISHRFSTVRNADRIIVIDKGQIVEEGTHDHLMSLDGYYAKSFLLQAQGYNG